MELEEKEKEKKKKLSINEEDDNYINNISYEDFIFIPEKDKDKLTKFKIPLNDSFEKEKIITDLESNLKALEKKYKKKEKDYNVLNLNFTNLLHQNKNKIENKKKENEDDEENIKEKKIVKEKKIIKKEEKQENINKSLEGDFNKKENININKEENKNKNKNEDKDKRKRKKRKRGI